jgi:hypothetical protein
LWGPADPVVIDQDEITGELLSETDDDEFVRAAEDSVEMEELLSALNQSLGNDQNEKEKSVIEVINPPVEEDEPMGELFSDDDMLYVDGIYSVIGEYESSDKSQNIAVEMRIDDGIIIAVRVVPLTLDDTERQLQEAFAEEVNELIIGEKLQNVPRFVNVAGGSAVPSGFQDALEKVRAEALLPVQNEFELQQDSAQ